MLTSQSHHHPSCIITLVPLSPQVLLPSQSHCHPSPIATPTASSPQLHCHPSCNVTLVTLPPQSCCHPSRIVTPVTSPPWSPCQPQSGHQAQVHRPPWLPPPACGCSPCPSPRGAAGNRVPPVSVTAGTNKAGSAPRSKGCLLFYKSADFESALPGEPSSLPARWRPAELLSQAIPCHATPMPPLRPPRGVRAHVHRTSCSVPSEQRL